MTLQTEMRQKSRGDRCEQTLQNRPRNELAKTQDSKKYDKEEAEGRETVTAKTANRRDEVGTGEFCDTQLKRLPGSISGQARLALVVVVAQQTPLTEYDRPGWAGLGWVGTHGDDEKCEYGVISVRIIDLSF